jgi:dTDP-4-dehydrorhamnose 3,5-epimerase-like enzyme
VSVADCRIIELPKIKDQRGNLTFVEENRHVPFPIRRVYYLYDVPGGEVRGGHAHRQLHQLIIAVSGSFEVVLDDGVDRVTRRLLRADEGLMVCPWTWRELQGFTSGAVCLVLASELFSEADYIRDYDAFRREVAK